MANPMQFVTVDKFELIGEDTVLFYIDLARHAHLRDPDVVRQSMELFTLTYPNVQRWSAVANGDGTLIIEVVGKVDLAAAAQYIKEQ